MKKAALGNVFILLATTLFGQGTILFTSHTTDRDNHIWAPSPFDLTMSLIGPGSNDRPSGTTPYQVDGMSLIGVNGNGGQYGAATTFAQLLAGPGSGLPESSLVPVGAPTTFHTGAAAGQIVAVTVTLTGVPSGTSAVTVEAVAWDNSSGLYGTWSSASVAWLSGLIAAGRTGETLVPWDPGTGTSTGPYVHDSFNLYFVPEPSTVAVIGLGAITLVVFRARASRRP